MRMTAVYVGLAICLLFTVQDAHATIIEIDPVAQTEELGQQVSIDITIDTGGEYLIGAFDFILNFDSDILSFVSLVFGGFMGNGSDDFFDPFGSFRDFGLLADGQLNLTETILGFDPSDYPQPDSFLLASITFDTVGLGQSGLSISDLVLGDFFGNSIGAGLGDGSITVTERPAAVPEPSTWLLLLAGLGLIAARRTRSAH